MADRFTRRALLLGSAGSALAGCTIAKPQRGRTITGVRIGRQAGAVDVAFLRDGVHAIAGDATAEPETFRGDRRLLVLRDAHTGRLLADLPGHDKVVKGIAFSPDGSSALSAGLNGELILWTMPRDDR